MAVGAKNLTELNKARTDEEARLDVVTGLVASARGSLDGPAFQSLQCHQ